MLIAAAQPETRPSRWIGPGDVSPGEEDLARAGSHQARASVEGGRLSGAVRSDQPGDPTTGGNELQAVNRGDPAEPNREVTDDQLGRPDSPARAVRLGRLRSSAELRAIGSSTQPVDPRPDRSG